MVLVITYCVRFFPAAGRLSYEGPSGKRSDTGAYWSSGVSTITNGWFLSFYNTTARLDSYYRTSGYSVRCVAQRG